MKFKGSSMQDIEKWLAKYQSDGVNLGIKELIHYQGKTALCKTPIKTLQHSKLSLKSQAWILQT